MRGTSPEKMNEAPAFRNILDRNIIGDNVTGEPCLQCFADARHGVDQQAVAISRDPNLRAQLAFWSQDASRLTVARRQACDVTGDLSIEVADPICASETQGDTVIQLDDAAAVAELPVQLRATHGLFSPAQRARVTRHKARKTA